MQEAMQAGSPDLDVRELVVRFDQIYANEDSTLDPQIERESMLLAALLQHTANKEADTARLSAQLSGGDLLRVAADHMVFTFGAATYPMTPRLIN